MMEVMGVSEVLKAGSRVSVSGIVFEIRRGETKMKVVRTWLGLVVSLLAITHPTPSRAAIDCLGLVSYALLYSDGTVNVLGTWRGDYTYLCNTNGTWGGVPAEVCLAWYATAVKAAAEGKQLSLYYNTSSYTCATIPTYGSSLVPTYVGMKQ